MAQIFRVERTKNFTVMSNHHFKNKNLTLKAKGLLSLMLSLPDDWNYNRINEQEQLEEEIKDVRDRNSKLQIQVNQSSVEAFEQAQRKQEEAEKQVDQTEQTEQA